MLGVTDGDVAGWIGRLRSSTGLGDASPSVRVLAVGPVGYYGAKNALADAAVGSILVFVDIDVIVEPGWLAALLEPFGDPTLAATFGYTQVGPLLTAYERAMAAVWVFDPRRPEDGGQPHLLRANNVAVRANVFSQHRFAPLAAEYRGACERLHLELLAAGERIERVSATTLHPPLSFPVDFVLWSLLSGRDRAVRGVRPGVRTSRFAPRPGRRRFAAVRARARAAGVRPVEVPVVILVGGSIRMLQAIGMVIGRVRPRLLDRWA